MGIRSHISMMAVVRLCICITILFSTTSQAAIPDPPSGLSAISGNTEASLTWDPVAGTESYAIYRSANIDGPFSFVGQTSLNGHADSNLINGSTYYYVVAAMNSDGQSPYSIVVHATPTLLALKAPANIRVFARNGEVTLSWDAVTSAVSYNVYRISPTGNYTLLTPPAPGLSYTDRSVTNGITYHYVVQTMSTNPGAYSYTVAAYPSALVPKAPASVTAEPGSSWARLSWAGSAGASFYLIYRGTESGGPYTYRGSVSSTVFEDTSLTNGTTYHYVIAAVNQHGSSAFSPEASAPVSLLLMPHATVLRAWPRENGATLRWDAAPGAVTYGIFRKESHDTSYPATPVASPSSTTSYSDTGLDNNTTYNYIVKSLNASTTAPISNEVAVTPVEALPMPTGVTVSPGNTQATISWNPVNGSYSYNVQVAQSPGGAAIRSATVYSGKTFYTATGLSNDQTYYFRVRSNLYEPSEYTVDRAATPRANLPLAPGSLSGEAGNTEVSLRWAEVPGASNYVIFRRTDSDNLQLLHTTSSSGTYFNDNGLVNDTKYYYIVAAVNDSGTGAWAINESSFTPTSFSYIAPTNITGIPGNTQVTVTWEPVQGATNYYLQIAETPGGPSFKTGYTHNGKTRYTFTSLTNDQDYYVRVRTTSMYSADIKVTPRTILPQAPTLLSARTGNTEVSLTWAVVETAVGYNIYRRTRLGSLPPIFVEYVNKTFMTDTGLDNGTEYLYTVAAVNSYGEGPWTANEVSAVPAAELALAPTGITGISGNTQITISWDPVVGAVGYSVIISTTPGGPQHASTYTNNGKTSATFANLINGITYYARVRATSPSASAEFGEAVVTPSVALPLAPTSLYCRASGNTQATISWGAVESATDYRIYRRTASSAFIPVALPASTLFNDTGLNNGIDYYYVVAAETGGNEGAWSSQEVKCSPVSDAPMAPTNVVAFPGDEQVELTWNQVAGATRYKVLRSLISGGQPWGYYTYTPNYTVPNLENGHTYYFSIQAENSSLKLSAYSSEVKAVPTDGNPDSDHDGIEDAWEILYFKSLAVCNGSTDFDGDGYTDLREYLNQKYNILDPENGQFDPKVINAPGGVGYGISSPGFWNLMMPAIMHGTKSQP